MSEQDIRAMVDQLRRSFDESFARPVAESEGAEVELLLVRAGATLQAVLIEELRGVRECPPITPVPSRDDAVDGVVGIRGNLVPVFPLVTLLGGTREHSSGEWLLLCGNDPQVGLRVDAIDGYARVYDAQMSAPDPMTPTPAHRLGVYRGTGEACDIISIKHLTDKLISSRVSGAQ